MTQPGIEPGSSGPLANTNHYANEPKINKVHLSLLACPIITSFIESF